MPHSRQGEVKVTQLILDNDDIYSGLCCGGSLECDARSIHVNTAFTAATVSLMVSSLPLGVVHDTLGPRTLIISSNIVIAIGALMVGLYQDDANGTSPSVDLFVLGFAVLSFAGGGLQMSYATAANLFPSNSGLVIGILSGFMGGSALTPRLLAVINAELASASLQAMYGAVAVLALGFAAFGLLLPDAPFPLGGRESDFGQSIGDLHVAKGMRSTGTGEEEENTSTGTAVHREDITFDSNEENQEESRSDLDEDTVRQESSKSAVGRGSSQVVLIHTHGTNHDAGIPNPTVPQKSNASTDYAIDETTGMDKAVAAVAASPRPRPSTSTCSAVSAAAGEYAQLLSDPRAVFLLLFFVVTYFRLVFYLGTASLQLGDMLGLRDIEVDGEQAPLARDAAAGGCEEGTQDMLSEAEAETAANQQSRDGALAEQARLEDEVEQWLSLLGWIAPIGAIMAAVTGYAYDTLGALWGMGIVVGLGLVHSVFVLVPVVEAQPVTFLTYTLQQEAIFAVILARVLAVYGAARFGVIAGTLFLIGALCAIGVTPITAVVLRQNDGEFFAANLGLLVLTLISAGYLYQLWREEREDQDLNKGDEQTGRSESEVDSNKLGSGGDSLSWNEQSQARRASIAGATDPPEEKQQPTVTNGAPAPDASMV